MTQEKSYLIIGAGLSGICVGIHLIENGHQVTLIDSGKNLSSIIAAGQINPLVFRRMTKSWRVDEFLPYAEKFYTKLESDTNLSIYCPIQIRRMFSSAHEKTMWLEKQNRPDFSIYMETITDEDDTYDLAQNDFGSGRIKRSSYVKAAQFLTGGKEWIKKHGTVITQKMNYQELDPATGIYQGKEYDGIIFCEGSENLSNPWFGNLPVEHTKGQVLTLTSTEISQEESLNRKCFLLPIGDCTFRLGATYEWQTNDTIVTNEAKDDLLEKFQLLSQKPFEITEHLAGIRPTIPDRRPILGKHPDYEKLLIFNGLGTKGYLIAPLLAKEFVDFVDGKVELDREVRIERFYK